MAAIMAKPFQKVIIVGQANTCNSVIAEAIMKKIAGDRKLQILSRGLVVLFPEPINPRALDLMEAHHLPGLKGYSEELTADDLTDDTLLLTMTEGQLEKVKNLIRQSGAASTAATLRGFVGFQGDVPDPSGDPSEYQKSYEHLDLLVKAAAQKIFEPLDEEAGRDRSAISEEEIEQTVQQLLEETLREAGQIETAADIAQKQKLRQEKELEEEYLSVVRKTAERTAAREAAKETEVSEVKQKIEQIKARKAAEKEDET